MYTLILDQKKDFNFELQVEGAKIDKTQARLIINSDDISMIFKGKIQEDGKVSITVPKLKNILEENQKGNMVLEVIAEDTYFTPWKEEYISKLNTKIDTKTQSNNNVLTESENKTSVAVKLINDNNKINDPIFELFVESIKNKGITLETLSENIQTIQQTALKYINIYGINSEEFINKVSNKLPEYL